MDIYEFIYSFSCLILFLFYLYDWLTIFQQEHYDYVRHLRSLINFTFNSSYIWWFYIVLAFGLLHEYLLPSVVLLGGLVSALWSLFLYPKKVIKLKFTARVFRLLITYLMVSMFIFYALALYSVSLASIILVIIVPIIGLSSNFINYPLEFCIRKYYIIKAKIRLENMRHLVKIGITGSYGKTSTKNIIASILENSYIVLASPKSYNTPMGISLTVNKMLTPYTEIFIGEMGAFREYEIEYLTNLVKPHIGIITDVGPQHLATFKTLNKVLKTKMEIFTSKHQPNIGITNIDNPLIKKELKSRKWENISFITVSLSDKNANLYCDEIEIFSGKTMFVMYQDGKKLANIKTPLLGRHNIYNIMFSVATSIALQELGYEIDFYNVIKNIETLKPTPNRLEYKKWNAWDIYDDSYNANYSGFINGLEVLKTSSFVKVIITPGIVDSGKELEELNQQVAKELLHGVDEVILIENEASKYIGTFLEKNNFNKYLFFPSFQTAHNFVKQKYKDQAISLLIENDLPDNFLRRK